MKFSVSSSALQSLLSSTGKVISSKNTLPILDYFLMEISDETLQVTTSDLETTLIGSIDIDNQGQNGLFAAPAKLLLDTLKEFAEMPIFIEVNSSDWEIKVSWKSGSLSIPGADPISYPQLHAINEENHETSIEANTLSYGINKTIYATADDELRPTMNGIFFCFEDEKITFVATDAHKLIKYSANIENSFNSSFILPKRPANLLKNLLLKEADNVTITFDAKSVIFKLSTYTMVCRLIEGNYPNYNAVIPANNPNKVLIDRIEFLNSIKRVAVCSNPTTNLIRLEVSEDSINLTAQDLDFSVSANESVSCSYDGQPIRIGFKSTFIAEILANTETPTVIVELADSTRAGVFKPVYDEPRTDETIMLLMPMMINA
ncbi:MAG: DNA polymerase III subunit beta [Rikenellaceae bacterium]